jgi:hypothetical protein
MLIKLYESDRNLFMLIYSHERDIDEKIFFGKWIVTKVYLSCRTHILSLNMG